MKLLDGKIAVITGAAKGIGRGIALEMAEEGARCVLVDIDSTALKATEEIFISRGFEYMALASDVSNYEENESLVRQVLATYDAIHILVNNAGAYESTELLDATVEQVEKVYRTNVLGPFFLTQRVAKAMIERNIEGSILFTSSTHSNITILRPAYSSSKAAIEMFVKDTALELSHYGIRVNAVAPGAIDIWGLADRKSEDVPIGELGMPEDVGKAMVFLASDKASYITGHTLVVDGAFSLAHTHYWKKKQKL